MAWQDNYVPGSFRGAAFVTQRHEHAFGRAGESHEYPYRETSWFEDLGADVPRWRLEVFVVGADYMSGRDALLAALKQPGAGTLVHPYLGTFQAQFLNGSLTESNEEGGMARFSLEFTEPGVTVEADQAADTQQASEDTADATDASAEARFADAFEPAGEPPFVDDAAVSLIVGIATDISSAGVLLGGTGPALRAFQVGLTSLGGASSLIASPATLAAVIVGLIGTLGQLGSRPGSQLTALRTVMASAAAVDPVNVITPTRQHQADNQQAIVDLVTAAAAGAAVRTVAALSFASYDDAVAVRDALGDDLDDAAVAAADRGNDALANDLDLLRRTMVADVTARGGSLAHLFSYTPNRVKPAVVIAWELYRDASSVLDQADAIVARNKVRHPGFVPAAPLQVLTATEGRSDV